MRYFIETSKGTVGINLTTENSLDKHCEEFLSNILSQIYDIDEKHPFLIEDNPEGVFLKINLKDGIHGRPEYKIRKRFIAQTLDMEMEDDIRWYPWCVIS